MEFGDPFDQKYLYRYIIQSITVIYSVSYRDAQSDGEVDLDDSFIANNYAGKVFFCQKIFIDRT